MSIELRPTTMNSIAFRRYKSTYAKNLKVRYQKPSVIIVGILDHRNGHSIKLNRVALKYLDFKTNVDLNVHVRMFNSLVKANVETSEEYIINVFSYMLRDTTLDWCHNYMSKKIDCTFSKLT